MAALVKRKLESGIHSKQYVVHCSAHPGWQLGQKSKYANTAHISITELDLNYQTSELTFIRLQRPS